MQLRAAARVVHREQAAARVDDLLEPLVTHGHSHREQALVAVMRKLLHAIYGMLRTNTDFDGSKFRKLPQAA